MAKDIEIAASRGCHLKGILFIPLKFKNPTSAVNKKEDKVTIPRYIIRGFPKIR